MRIAHIVSTFPPYHGGQGNVAREIAERMVARGNEVVVVTPERMNNGKLQMDNSEIIHYPLSIIHSRALARAGNAAWCPDIHRTLEELQPDIVHLHWPFIGGVAPALQWRAHTNSQDNLSQFRTKLRKEVTHGSIKYTGSLRGASRRERRGNLVHSPRDCFASLAMTNIWESRPFSALLSKGKNYSPIRTNRRIVGQPRQLIVHYHMDLVGEGWRGAAFSAYQRLVLPRALAVADCVVVSSLDYARHGALAPYVDRLGDRLIEIPLGVDVERFRPHESPLPPSPPSPQSGEGGETKKNFSPFRLEGERLVLRSPRGEVGEGVGFSRLTTHDSRLAALFVGGLDRAHAFKGLPVLLKAIKQCQTPSETVSDIVSLRIIGDGDRRPAYEAQARELGISDRVEFLGSVPDAALPDVYRGADVLVLPSTSRSEAFGVVLLEAMASGIPVIASDLPGVRTVVANGETGFLVPPGDAGALATRLQEIATDRERTRAMGRAARSLAVERYAWDRIIGQWEQLYQSCALS